jgi:hypothetical protein
MEVASGIFCCKLFKQKKGGHRGSENIKLIQYGTEYERLLRNVT